MDFLRHAATFVRIADAGSLSSAARSLSLSVAMVSRQLSALERELGVELIRRNTRSLQVTEHGEAFLAQARRLMDAETNARNAVEIGAAQGRLLLSVPTSFALPELGGAIAAIAREHPRLTLDVRYEDRFVDLLAEGVDLAVRAGATPPDSPFLGARKLGKIDRILVASPKLLAQHGKIKTLRDLASAPCLTQGQTSAWTFGEDGRAVSVEIRSVLRTNSIVALRQLAIDGLGVARLPSWLAKTAIEQKALVRIVPTATLASVDLYAVFPQASRRSTALRAALDVLEKRLPPGLRAPVT
ncbi:MAG: LysR family transcriptional regulator [Myxococcales bacterium]|nr:LysR family transcriptional regulator [Myxococcales bacterium]